MARPLRILLAEDNPVNQKVTTLVLQRLGHAVEVVGNGLEALAALDQGQFDLVLMDLQMPELDGLAAVSAIRAKEGAAGERLPIVAMTAAAAKGDRHRCLEAGMDAYLVKPVDSAELCSTIEELFSRGLLKAPRQDQASASPVDEATLLQRYEGDKGLISQLASLLRQQQPKLLAALRQAAERGDGRAVHEAIHTLKGSLAHLRANAACAAAQTIEQVAASGDWGRFEEAYSALHGALLDCDAALAAILERPSSPRVLIVEDEPVSRRVLRRDLEKLGYDVAEANSGAAAWELFQSGGFPIVISDWLMPDMDGLELIRRIRSSPRPGRPYVILLTAASQGQSVQQAVEAGADDVLTKPFDPSQLAARLRSAQRTMLL